MTLRKSQDSKQPKSEKSSTKTPKSNLGPMTMEQLMASTGNHVPALRRGQEVQGTIVALGDEMLVDFGAKSEGIIYSKELALARDLISKLVVGDKIDAVVVYPENEAGQVVLSLRKLSADRRWANLEEKRDSEEILDVIAVEANKGGLVCEWNGIRGFLPASQLAAVSNKLEELIGKTVQVKIIELEKEGNRLIFTQKSTDSADSKKTQTVLSKIKIGDKYKGEVTAVLPFGVFVEIEIDGDKIEGLVHISEIAWEKVDDPSKMFKVDQKLEVLISSIDTALGRVNLSTKQLADDPFMRVSEKYTKDQITRGTIAKIVPKGAIITLEDGVEGQVNASKIPAEWQVGQTVECVVESIDAKSRKIQLVPVAHEKPILYR